MTNEVGMLWELVALAGVHFLGDFVLQNNWMALNKSKASEAFIPPCGCWDVKHLNFEGLKALGAHVGVYTLCFFPRGVYFMLALFFLHFVTDFFTSGLTSRLWFVEGVALPDVEERRFISVENRVYTHFDYENLTVAYNAEKRHWFFVAIGFDQLLHLVQIAFLLHWGV